MSGGIFISFEGSEGCGKSTQAHLLADRLRSSGRCVHELREPGGTLLGEEIRHTLKYSAAGEGMTPEAELLLLNAARAQLVRQVIRPALAAGEIVVCDRFYDSTVAYQGWGRGLDLDRIAEVIRLAVGETSPGLTVLLRVPVEVGEARRQKRSETPGTAAPRDRFERAGADFFQRVEAGYEAIAVQEKERMKAIQGTGSLGEVQAAIWSLVTGRWPELAGSK